MGSVLIFLLILGILVFFHELGHFLAAKMLGMRVLEFAFNMGPKVIRLFHDGETEYTIRAIPLGGFVRIAGMEAEEEVERALSPNLNHALDDMSTTNMRLENAEAAKPIPDTSPVEDPRGYNSRPVWQRFIVILAGPVFSFLLGWATLCLIGVVVGIPDKTQLGVQEVIKGSVAEQVGLRGGDTITTINGTPVNDYAKAMDQIHTSAGVELALRIKDKNGAERDLKATPRSSPDPTTGKNMGLLGFQSKPVTLSLRRTSFGESIHLGNTTTLMWFDLMGKLITSGAITKSVGGPVAIFKATDSASKQGGPDPMLLLGQLSLSLGLFNLFPIPILDGGHLLLLTLEALRGRKLTPAWTARVQYAGLAVLLAIFVSVMFKDIGGLLHNG